MAWRSYVTVTLSICTNDNADVCLLTSACVTCDDSVMTSSGLTLSSLSADLRNDNNDHDYDSKALYTRRNKKTLTRYFYEPYHEFFLSNVLVSCG